ncbi:MAG: twin-arginine translocation signal domain-containing protein [Ignavibacteriaceae bacterium]|nr:twin-arginine translocation signal domain-containing protein [Ignavibacteriaceae bacterium]
MKTSYTRRDFMKTGAVIGAGAILFPAIMAGESFLTDDNSVPVKNNSAKVVPPHIRSILEYAVMAPSGHNTQPWKIAFTNNSITIYPDFSRRLPVVDPDDRELLISLGCIAETILITARAMGYQTGISLNEEEPSIRIDLIPGSEKDYRFLSYIKSRQCTRNMYDGKSIPEDHIRILSESEKDLSAGIHLLSGEGKSDEIVSATAKAARIQYENPAFMDELKFWIRFNRAEAEEKQDGLFSASSGNPQSPRWIGKLFMNLFFSCDDQIKNECEMLRSSSALFLITTPDDSLNSLIDAGRLYMRFSVISTSLNIKSAFHNQPVEEGSTRFDLSEIFDAGSRFPQLLLRAGYSERMPDSPFRRVDNVII